MLLFIPSCHSRSAALFVHPICKAYLHSLDLVYCQGNINLVLLFTNAPFSQGCDLRVTAGLLRCLFTIHVRPISTLLTYCIAKASSIKWPFSQGCGLRATFERPEKWSGAMEAQALPWSPNEDTVLATVIAQWTLLVGQGSHHDGTGEAKIKLRLKYSVYNRTHYFMGRPLVNNSASILLPWRCVCLPLPLLSDLWATNLLGDLSATVFNTLKTSRWWWRPWRSLAALCTT